MDISKFTSAAFQKTHTFHPVLPNGQIGDFKVEVRSVKHPVIVEYLNEKIRLETIKSHNNRKQGHADIASLTDIEADSVEYAGKLLVSFSDADFNGKPLESNKENMSMLVNDCDWLRKQIIDEAGVEQNFFGL